MLTYPNLIDALAGRDLNDLAAVSGVDADTIRDVAAGGWTAPFALRDRLARALDANPIELFRLEPELEQALASAPTRYITDPAVLRVIDRQPERVL